MTSRSLSTQILCRSLSRIRGARCVIVAIASLLSTACSSQPVEDKVAQGAAAYARYCALCHGNQGEGYKADQANALAHPEFLATATDEHLRRAIVRGRPGTTMSAWGMERMGPLDAPTVETLIAYLRYWQRTPSLAVHDQKVVGDIARAEPIFAERCQSCHGPRGSGLAGGGSAMSIANPEYLFTASDGSIRHAISYGRVGTPMPAFLPELSSQQVDDLVVLIRSWQRPPSDTVLTAPDRSGPAVVNPAGREPTFGDGRFVPVDVVKRELDIGARMVILDARPPADYVLDHITGAVSIPFYEVEKHTGLLPKDAFIVAYCACPHAESGTAIDALSKLGFSKLKVLDEGVGVWKARGYPMKSGPKP